MRELLKLKEENLLFFDIETAPLVKELKLDTPLFDSWKYKVNKTGDKDNNEIIKSYSKEAGLYPEFAKVISIVVGVIHKGEIILKTYDHADEVELLNSFNETLNDSKNLKKKLIGFVNIGFDTPFVFKRMLINGITPSDKVDSSGLKPWEVDEIDLGKIWQGTSFNRASLINIVTAFGLPSPKDDISGVDVGRVYWKDNVKGLERISTYCAKDVKSTINIFRKMCLRKPLKVSMNINMKKQSEKDKVKEEEEEVLTTPIIVHLFNGGKYGDTEKKKLKQAFDDMTEDERNFGYIILNSIVSTARGKKTKFLKKHIKELKDEYKK